MWRKLNSGADEYPRGVDMNVYSKMFLMLNLIFITACSEATFSAGSLALKQVPADNTVDEELGAINEEEVISPDLEPVTINLRDKVLINSDISSIALDNALDFYDQFKNNITNQKVITVFDVTQHSSKKRMYVIDTENGNVTALHSAHGTNSDTNNDGFATTFSNNSGSNQTSLGFMLTAETYYSAKNGLSLRLDGLESRNSKARPRLVVVHGANYVNEKTSQVGRSFGCPAISHNYRDWYINKSKNGSLMYIYHAAHDG